jgi:hypothetical protein
LPQTITSVEQLEDLLSAPTPATVEALRKVKGDILILGVAGKMGPNSREDARPRQFSRGRSPRSRRVIGSPDFPMQR